MILSHYSIEKRLVPSSTAYIFIPLLSVFLALIFGSVFLSLSGFDFIKIYTKMFSGAFGSSYGLSETIVRSIPLTLTGLGVALAFRMQLWNIGGEGQLYMGAFAATWVALTFPSGSAWWVLPSMMLLSMLAGGLWALLTAIPKALWGVNEIITTLMLNYVAIFWVDYLVYGPWKDPDGFNFPLTAPFGPGAILPALGSSRIHTGLFFGLVLAVLFYVIIYHTRWGYEIRVTGENPNSAKYAGMNTFKNIILVMVVSGAICGLAGMSEVSGIGGRLQHGLSPGYGFTAIIVAWLSRLNPFAIIIVAFLLGGLEVGGYIVQTSGIPSSMVSMLQGMLLFFVLGGELLTNYKISKKPVTTLRS
ncbi:nucleoside ABC transporter membrane protein [Desulfotomaculum arcticum]|uniref:Nucleoside ABC transporter membrane protein n=2 Tax=Desulfotruncus TaxID=2867377 RepID=A0A1I2NI53_9FIRM|nr:ABC transporter permease [Desulfotruncus arcticus]SFG00981.1 nucleoside ABC transporter membrane protein [Desulfotomaculum arcticum] [Desulfotruncus arcticus DSM 17038]